MINSVCACGVAYVVSEADVGKPLSCRKCGRELSFATAEALEDGAGAADFDARLVIEGGPAGLNQQILLGGVPDIELGKLPECHVCLAGGAQVSRRHCRLSRIDFGPSRWKVVDNKSTNGVFVNGQRVTEKELEHDDVLQVGEYRLRYLSDAALPAPAAPTAAATAAPTDRLRPRVGSAPLMGGGPPCPSCDQPLAPGAKICVRCGIYADTGRPLITAQGMDEDALYIRAETWIKFVSWLVWVTPLPMPLASEAYGARKPYTIWAIAALTVLTSIIFFASQAGPSAADTKNLMLWNPKATATAQFSFDKLIDEKVSEIVSELDADERRAIAQDERTLRRQGKSAADAKREAVKMRYAAELAELEAVMADRFGQFKPYQLLSHALLHDTSHPIQFVLHLGGNLLFLLVFGTRVNSLLGNIAAAVCYPVLAVSAAAVHLMTLTPDDSGPMLGASGAIMGLAGMYLILFPVHRVYCAMWIRIRWHLFAKIFTLRGFWVLLIYFAYDAAMQFITSDGEGGVAHWAHMGGFLTGVVLALAVLLSRQFNCRGADLLSVVLGRHAWPLLGKPSRWGDQTAPAGVPAVPVAAVAAPMYASPQRL